jgi:hypothetical protein
MLGKSRHVQGSHNISFVKLELRIKTKTKQFYPNKYSIKTSIVKNYLDLYKFPYNA